MPKEPQHKTDKMTCTLSDDSGEPGHPPSLIRVFAVRMKKLPVRMKKLPIECLAKTLIRLGGCPDFPQMNLSGPTSSYIDEHQLIM